MADIEMVCIACPNGCKLSIKKEEDKLLVTGNKCPKGETFAKEEVFAPKRSVTTTVASIYDELPTVPVRTDGDIPKELIFDFIREMKRIKLDRAYDFEEPVVGNFLNTGIDVICSVDMHRILGE